MLALSIITFIILIVWGIILLHSASQHQQAMIKEWLLYAVTQAEKELGAGTGQIKLRYVYNMFIEKFPKASKKFSFEKFSILVDEVLKKFEAMLRLNNKIKNYVNKEENK